MDTRDRPLAVLVIWRATQRIARLGRITFALCGAVLFCPRPAIADQFDTVNFVLGDTLTHDANVFRTPDGASAQSDRINQISAGVKIDKPYAQQRFQADVTKILTRYDNFSSLNVDALNYRGAWLWALTPRVTGALGADRSQAQIPFAQIGGTQRNVRTTNNRNFNVDGLLGGGWHLLAGLGRSESTTEQTLLSLPSYRSHRVEAGLRYTAASGNMISFIQRSSPTVLVNQPLDAVNLIDTDYTDAESELRASWRLSGNSAFDGTLTRKRRSNDHFAQRDFTGMAGEIRYLWTPAGKLQFSLTAGRAVAPYAAFGNTIENSTYRIDQSLSFGAEWNAAAKVALRLNLGRTRSDFAGPVFVVTGPARSDDFQTARISADWTPVRNLSLSAGIERDRRASNVTRFEFSDTLTTLSAALNF
jgi:exopolysaccharide biosynthesis operon protein EpsL